MSEWISVEDRLPKQGEEVWVWKRSWTQENEDPTLGYLNGERFMVSGSNDDGHGDYGFTILDGPITHWSPYIIPDPPEV